MRKQIKARKRTAEQFNNQSDDVLGDAIRLASGPNPEAIDIEGLLIDAGLDDVLDSMEAAFGEEIDVIGDNFELLTGREVFGPDDIRVIQAISGVELERIAAISTQFGIDIKAEFIRSQLVGAAPNLSNLDDLKERFGNRIETEFNTAVASFCRTLTIIKAVDEFGENPEFQYIGPDDEKTREFCQDVLDQPIRTLNEILQLDNEQGLDVFSSGGGFNCRHEWFPTGN